MLPGRIADGNIVCSRVVPGLITLASDAELTVRAAALTPLVLVAAAGHAVSKVNSSARQQLMINSFLFYYWCSNLSDTFLHMST